MKNYSAYVRSICKLYNCSDKTAEKALQQAYMLFLSKDELEKFILQIQLKEIMKQEMKLNRSFVVEKRPNKRNSIKENKKYPYKKGRKLNEN